MLALEKCLVRSFSHILIGLFVFLVLTCMSCLYILEISPLSVSFAIIFFHSEGCLFILLIVSFALQKLLSLIRSYLFIFVFISITLGGNGTPLQYSGPENSMDCTVHRVTKSGTQLSDLHLTLQASKHLVHGSFSLFHLAFFLFTLVTWPYYLYYFSF